MSSACRGSCVYVCVYMCARFPRGGVWCTGEVHGEVWGRKVLLLLLFFFTLKNVPISLPSTAICPLLIQHSTRSIPVVTGLLNLREACSKEKDPQSTFIHDFCFEHGLKRHSVYSPGGWPSRGLKNHMNYYGAARGREVGPVD